MIDSCMDMLDNFIGREHAVVDRDLVDLPFERGAVVYSAADGEPCRPLDRTQLDDVGNLGVAVEVDCDTLCLPIAHEYKVMPGLGHDIGRAAEQDLGIRHAGSDEDTAWRDMRSINAASIDR